MCDLSLAYDAITFKEGTSIFLSSELWFLLYSSHPACLAASLPTQCSTRCALRFLAHELIHFRAATTPDYLKPTYDITSVIRRITHHGTHPLTLVQSIASWARGPHLQGGTIHLFSY